MVRSETFLEVRCKHSRKGCVHLERAASTPPAKGPAFILDVPRLNKARSAMSRQACTQASLGHAEKPCCGAPRYDPCPAQNILPI